MITSVFTSEKEALRLCLDSMSELADRKNNQVIIGRVVGIRPSKAFPQEYIVDFDQAVMIPSEQWQAQQAEKSPVSSEDETGKL